MKNSINQLIRGGLMLVLVAFMASCSEIEEQTAPMANSTLKSIPEVLKSLETGYEGQNTNARKSAGNTYATFNAALGKSGLASVFAKNELTVFAPTDAAFAEFNLNPGNIGSVEGLTDILLYHVVAGSVFAADLTEGFVTTVNGAAVEIKLMGGPKVNDANIILVDKQARNGVIHGIDKVLFPPTKNIMELVDDLVEKAGDFSTLQAAIDAADLRDALVSLNNITVFAPNDAAFAKLGLDATNVGSVPGLADILLYHVFASGRVYSSDLMNGPITMAQNGIVTVNTSGPKLIDANDGESFIIGTDVQATNGVVHVIDTVIFP